MQLIFESERKNIFCRKKSGDDSPAVVIKVLKDDHPTPSALAYLENELEITKSLNIEGVRKAYKKTYIDDKEALILEYIKGQTIRDAFVKQRKSIKEFLEIAVSIARTLGEIHQHNIIHKDINGNNILIDDETRMVKIIDFSISSRISIKTPHLGNPDKLEGTLAYVSPEQTGRVNRVVDHRTDLYSLGVTFYEILTGELPFLGEDLSALIHAHIAHTPKAPVDVDATIPLVLSDMVMKLMHKNAEDRYQSAFGLKGDLENCLQQIRRTGTIEPFEIASNDFTTQFKIPERLYGREKELGLLDQAFSRVSQGATEMLVVSGYSGVGKSALINEMQKTIMEKRGFFIFGKFDQLQKTIPYYAIARAFQQFINLLLTEDEEQLAVWKNTIQKAVGTVGRVLIDVIPNLEYIIGEQPEVPELGGMEAQNRFNYVFKTFLKSIAQPEHPVVLFADDLQWADTASLDLIKLIQTDIEIHNFLLFGAYIENEVSPSHPTMLTLREIKEGEGVVHEIALSNLSFTDVNQLTADALYSDLFTTMPLAKLIVEKTHGNPFFVNQFLQNLYEEKLLVFDLNKHRWKWDIEEVSKLKITDNVVELMADKIEKLPYKTQELLKLAACMGFQFDLSNLAIINEKSHQETAKLLWVALEEGLIIPLGTEYKVVNVVIYNGHSIRVQYQFVHDYVQHAAYQLISDSDKKAVHLSIGQLLLSKIRKEDRDHLLFDIVNHLNKGMDLILSGDKKEELAWLNLEAGEKAKLSAAYERALSYFQTGIGLLQEIRWGNCYELKLALHTHASEVSCLLGDYKETEENVEIVIKHAKTVLDTVRVCDAKLCYYLAEGKLLEARKSALSILKQLGISFPNKPTKMFVFRSLLMTKLLIKFTGYSNLLNLPVMKDPNKIAAMRILTRLSSIAYLGFPELMPLTSLKMVRLSIRYGNNDLSAFCYAGYGLLLSGILNQIESGYRYGQLALSLVKKYNLKDLKTKVLFLNSVFINPWKIHLNESIAPLKEAYRIGLETGDIEYGVYALNVYPIYSFYTNAKLPDLLEELSDNKKVIFQLNQAASVHRVNLFQQVLLNLMGESDYQSKLLGKAYDEEKMIPEHIAKSDKTTAFLAFYNKVYLCYSFGRYEQALEHSETAKKYEQNAIGSVLILLLNVYESLSRLALYPDCSKSEQRSHLKKVRINQKKMRKWSSGAPMNFLHQYYLIKAECYKVRGIKEKARTYYDEAISLAKKNDHLSEEALAYELAGKFFQESQLDHVAAFYLEMATKLYALWGAKAKVLDIEKRYIAKTKYPLHTDVAAALHSTMISTATSKLGTMDSFNLSSIIKASNTMSEEVKLNSLLDKMIHIVIQNAGAEKCALVLHKSGTWFIRATAAIKDRKGALLTPIPLDDKPASSTLVPTSIIHYVIRTQQELLFSSSRSERRFSNDPYIQQNHPKSVLCLPIFNHGDLYGVLYLENNLTVGAFTQENLEILHLLSSQIAISLENANLYENLEEKVDERTIWITQQKKIIEEKNKDITASIRYAQQIQRAILTSDEYLQKMLPEHFVLLKPKDIVSGDFYWGHETNSGKAIWVTADCTGHGVPGALMSMIASSLLNEVVIERGIDKADQILNELKISIIKAFGQSSGSIQQADGLDAAICILDKNLNKLEFAGAFNPLYIVRKGISKEFKITDPKFIIHGDDLLEIKGDRRPISFDYNREGSFDGHEIQLQHGDMLYTCSDGFQDQFGGEKGKKFSAKRLRNLMLSMRQKSMSEQKDTVTQTIETWRSDKDQVDDMLMIGVRV